MPDYQKGLIYKIVALNCEDPNEIYFGSTTQKLANRMGCHRKDFIRWKEGLSSFTTSFNLFETYGIENCKILLVETYPCNSKYELQAKEAEHILKNNCVNKCIPNRTKKQWELDNADRLKQKKKQYRLEHKEQHNQWKVENKEKIREQERKYYKNNEETLKEKAKIYREENADKIKTYNDQYWKDNAETLKEKNNKRRRESEFLHKHFNCECGGKYTHQHKLSHSKSQRHIKYINEQTEQTEL